MASTFTKKVIKLKSERTLTGTFSVSAASKNVTGVGTLFSTELAAGDFVWISSDELGQVDSITSNTVLTLKENVTTAVTTGKMKRTGGVLYTVPEATTSIVHSFYVSNLSLVDFRKFTLRIFDKSTNSWIVVANRIEIPLENSYSHPKPINLLTGDKLHFALIDGTDNEMHVYASILEQA